MNIILTIIIYWFSITSAVVLLSEAFALRFLESDPLSDNSPEDLSSSSTSDFSFTGFSFFGFFSGNMQIQNLVLTLDQTLSNFSKVTCTILE